MAGFEKEETRSTVVEIVMEKLHVDKEAVLKAQTFQDLGADSLDMVEIIMKLEEIFGVDINDEDAEQLTSIDQVVDYIHHLRTK